jgi:hypothetical protein
MSILILGYYYRYNSGDDAFGTVFSALLGDKAIIRNTDDINEIPNDVKLVICGGGDIINHYFLDKITSLVKKRSVPVIAISVGIPFESCLNKRELNIFDHIVIRNKIDLPQLVQRFGDQYVKYYPDLTYLLPSIIPYEKTKMINKNYFNIGFFLVRNIFMRNNNYGKIVAQLATFLNLIQNYKVGGKPVRILLIPFCCNTKTQNEDDFKINNDVMKNVKNTSSIINVDRRLEIPELFNLVRDLDLGICMRLHSHIFCYMNNVPMISIAFTRKVKNFMVENGMENFVYELPLDDQYYYPTDCNPDKLLNMVDSMINSYDTVKQTLVQKNKINFEQIAEFKDYFFNIIENPTKRIGAPTYISDDQIDLMVDQIIVDVVKHLQNVRNDKREHSYYTKMLKDGKTLQEVAFELVGEKEVVFWNKIKVEITSIILLRITGLVKPIYYYGLHDQIFMPDYNIKESIKWIYNHMCCHTDYGRPLGNSSQLYLENSSSYKKKINIGYISQDDFRSVHRSGWSDVIYHLEGLHDDKNNIILDTYLDRTFHWGEVAYKIVGKIPFTQPWIGFIHHTFDQTFSPYNVPNMLLKDSFIDSLPYCRGLFVLSHDLKYKTEKALEKMGFNIPIQTLIHPTDTKCPKFSINKFLKNGDRKLVQIGGWLRQTFAIFKVNIINNSLTIRKVALKGKEMNQYYPPSNFDDMLENIIKLCGNNKFAESLYSDIKDMMHSVQIIDKLDDKAYDNLLSENIVFINLIDASAVNTVVECIIRETPILVNPIPAVIEVLGTDYPLYFEVSSDVENLLTIENIKAAHEHLKKLDKEKFTMIKFMSDFVNSPIYSTLD